jgi:DNA mismatch repair protein MutS
MATENSFVILDEIGRGTSTFDGISLAWAIIEFLHNKVKCKTLFATHYHELTELASELSSARNYHIAVSQNEDGIIFLRKIQKGGISDSFGIEVAKLAGVPKEVISNARDVLNRLESENLLTGKPNLFNIPRQKSDPLGVSPKLELSPKEQEILDIIKTINPDELSPKRALERWYEVHELVNN